MTVQFTITPSIKEALGVALSSGYLSDELRPTFQVYYNTDNKKDKDDIGIDEGKNVGTIAFTHIQELSRCLQKLNLPRGAKTPHPVWLHELVHGADIIVPSTPKPQLSKEAIERKARLTSQYNHMKYNEMTKHLSFTKEDEARQATAEMADHKSQLGMGMNMILLLFAGLVFGWYVGSKWLGSDLWGLVFGLLLAMVALIAETSLFIIKLSRVDAAGGKPVQRYQLPASFYKDQPAKAPRIITRVPDLPPLPTTPTATEDQQQEEEAEVDIQTPPQKDVALKKLKRRGKGNVKK